MPQPQGGIDPFWSGVIGAGAGIVGQGINAAWQGAVNKKTRKWNEKMYGIQRADALADWNRQNEYNSPTAVMKRLKDAGLNPHLFHANQNEGATIRSSSPQQWSPHAGAVDTSFIPQMLMMIYDLAQKRESTESIRQQIELQKQQHEAGKLAIDRSQLQYDTDKVLYGTTIRKAHAEAYNAELESKLKEGNIDIQKVQKEIVQRTKENRISLAVQEYTNAQLQAASMRANTAKTWAERSKIYKEIENLKEMNKLLSNDAVIKQIEVDFARKGILKGDNAVFRAIQGTFSEIFERLFGE